MGFFFNNLAWKILSLLVAFGIWFVVMSSNSIEITKEVSLDLDIPSGLIVANEVPDRVTFRLSGSKFFLRTLANSLDSIHIDLTKAKSGPTYYKIEKESLHLPIGVKILSISPSTINPVLEPVDRRSVPVEVVKKNSVPNGYRLVRLQAMPKNVRIKGPRNVVERISVIRSQPVDLSDIPASLKWELPLTTGYSGVAFDEEVQPKISVEVEPTGSNFRVAGVPLQVKSSKEFTVNPDKVALYVNCPPNLIKTLTPEKVRAYVDVPETKAGTYVREVKADLPRGVKLVRVVPERVQVQID
jgi:YbbR domain-containing protein